MNLASAFLYAFLYGGVGYPMPSKLGHSSYVFSSSLLFVGGVLFQSKLPILLGLFVDLPLLCVTVGSRAMFSDEKLLKVNQHQGKR